MLDLVPVLIGLCFYFALHQASKNRVLTESVERYARKASLARLYFFGPVVLGFLSLWSLVFLLGPSLAWFLGENQIVIEGEGPMRLRHELPPGIYSIGSVILGGAILGFGMLRFTIQVFQAGLRGLRARN